MSEMTRGQMEAVAKLIKLIDDAEQRGEPMTPTIFVRDKFVITTEVTATTNGGD